MKISYAITVCNELEEITNLLNFLQTNIKEDDEIVIQYDESTVTDDVLDYLKLMDKMHTNHKVIGFPLNKDFASFKNNLKSHCSKDYIFQIDADEIPHKSLMKNLKPVLEANPTIDLYWVPRVNTVDGITQEHINKWGWGVDDNGWVNFPDYQGRIWRNRPNILWKNKVHEVLIGYQEHTYLPAEEQFSFYHPKTIDRQEKQNKFYDTI